MRVHDLGAPLADQALGRSGRYVRDLRADPPADLCAVPAQAHQRGALAGDTAAGRLPGRDGGDRGHGALHARGSGAGAHTPGGGDGHGASDLGAAGLAGAGGGADAAIRSGDYASNTGGADRGGDAGVGVGAVEILERAADKLSGRLACEAVAR